MKNAVADATVNDVVLAICGGALRAYLDAKHELPADPLVAMAPISTRKNKADYSMGNQVSAMFIAIGTHIADPKERLQTIRDLTRSAKEMTNAIGADLMTRYGDFYPAATQNLAARLTAEYARGSDVTPPFNCSITNVPGPQVPLYTMGCETVTTVGYDPSSTIWVSSSRSRAITANSASALHRAAILFRIRTFSCSAFRTDMMR